jgi:hypothetical protein
MSGYWSTNFLALSPPKFTTFDLSGFYFQSQAQISDLRSVWNTFEQIQVCNIAVSTSIGLGTTQYSSGINDPLFYQFRTAEEKNRFTRGQQLHIARYPYINFSTSVR